MRFDDPEAQPVWRIYTFLGLTILGLCVLVGAMIFRQVYEGRFWEEQMAQSSTRLVKIPPPRGLILDRNGVTLVGNRPSYNVALYLDEFGAGRSRAKLLRSVGKSIQELKDRMKMDVHVNDNVVAVHHRLRGPLPLTVWTDLSPAAMAAFQERSPWMKGVDLQIEPVRVYPFGTLASHVLGYVGKPVASAGRDSMYDAEGRRVFSQPSVIGKSGIEENFEEFLTGTPGSRVIRLSATGMKESEVVQGHAAPGNNVVLTLDQGIQSIVEEVFVGYRGACVVLDTRNGDILALASFPAFNPNQFIPAIKRSDWNTLISDLDKPLLNRAIQGTYHPGSTFKVVTALAGLESGLITAKSNLQCTGRFHLGPVEFKCWETGGHGDMRLREALTMSCNVYFYDLGRQLGGPPIWEMSAHFGLGDKTGIPLDHELRGLLPTEAWKRQRLPKEGRWSAGDSVNMSIGQGFLEVTPLQMAVVAAAIGNGGTVHKTRLVARIENPQGEMIKDYPTEVKNRLPVRPEHIELVREAMVNVVENGTGKRAAVPKIKVAAKTGSAQTPSRDPVTRQWVKKTMAWLISFAPEKDTRYALAIIAEGEESASGGKVVAPMAGKIYGRIFQLEQDRLTPKPPPAVAALPISEKIEGVEGEVAGEILGENQSDIVERVRKEQTPEEDEPDEEIEPMSRDASTARPPNAYPAERVVLP
jgi:penicillin-binding protein 2